MTEERDEGAWRFSFTVRDGQADEHKVEWDASAQPLTADQRRELGELLFGSNEDA
jgi:hypothetical protein